MTTTAPELSADQVLAHDAVLAWFGEHRSKLLTLGGYAGTGKTTTLGAIVRTLKEKRKKLRVGFSCFTGKASLVLRGKLEAARVLREGRDYCGTLHGLIYRPDGMRGGQMAWKRVPRAEMAFDLFVLDEASMVSEQMLADLSSYGIPILAVGDHGQLPPVEGALNLMKNPDIKLEKIHRQAEGSPIIRMSMLARLEGRIPVGVYGPGVFKTNDPNFCERLGNPKNGVVICGTNNTRTRLNKSLRLKAGHLSALPEVGEPTICLRNDADAGIYNGMVGVVRAVAAVCPEEHVYQGKPCPFHLDLDVDFPGAGVRWRGAVLREQFGAPKTTQGHPAMKWHQIGQLFDWGYALTAHKSQGAEWENVVVVEETGHMREDDDRRRWLYTAVTRARTRLAVVGR